MEEMAGDSSRTRPGGVSVLLVAVRLIQAGLISILISMIWPALRGAPWVPSRRRSVRRMLEMAGVRAGEVVYDLGSGDGRVLIAAARDFGARSVGVEIDPLRAWWTRLRVAAVGLRDRVSVVRGDFFTQDLASADVVVLFLTQATNDRLADKLRRELRPGARVISNRYVLRDWPVAAEDVAENLRLYVVDGGADEALSASEIAG